MRVGNFLLRAAEARGRTNKRLKFAGCRRIVEEWIEGVVQKKKKKSEKREKYGKEWNKENKRDWRRMREKYVVDTDVLYLNNAFSILNPYMVAISREI